jgi:hypothetical protein
MKLWIKKYLQIYPDTTGSPSSRHNTSEKIALRNMGEKIFVLLPIAQLAILKEKGEEGLFGIID